MTLHPFLGGLLWAGAVGTLLTPVWALARRHLRSPGPIMAGGLLLLAWFLWIDLPGGTWLPGNEERAWSHPAPVLWDTGVPLAQSPSAISGPDLGGDLPADAVAGWEADWAPAFGELAWLVWSTGALVSASVLVGRGGWAALKRRRGSALVGFERGLRVRMGPGARGAQVSGWWRPTLWLPGEAQFWDAQVRALVVAHEATHVRLGHLWLGRIVDLTACVQWYTPAVWWLRRALADDREPVCDQACLRGQPLEVRHRYATALVHLASEIRGAPAWSRAGVELKRRIMMITELSRKRGRKTALLASGAALAFLGLLVSACVSTGAFRASAPVSELVGTWTTVDFVAHPDDFIPGVRSFQDPDLLEGLSWDGRGPWMMQVRGEWERSIWTVTPREVVRDGLKGPWFVAHLGGKVYLAFAWLSGDVARGQSPHYYILEKTAPPRAAEASYPVDRTPPGAFVDDPAVAGSWKSVAFVDAPEAFDPGKTTPGLYLSGLEFQPSGRLQVTAEKGTFEQRWSQGYLWWASDRVRSPYTVKRVGNRDYLFVTWINGDVLDRGQVPSYYVLSR